jgi:soluble lytic murein transglycosylase
MATVPRLNGPSVAPEALPGYRQQNPVDPSILGAGARQIQQAGDALVGAGTALEAIRKQALDETNALRVDDALNQATEAALRLQHDPKDGYTTQKGYDALKRESGQPLADEYTGRLETEISTIASGLGNDQQRRLFAMKANNIRTSFRGSAMAYESKEGQDYNLSVREATVKNAANALVLNFADPTNVEQQETRIRAAWMGAKDPDTGAFIPGAAQLKGMSAAWAQEMASQSVSAAHLGAIKSALDAGNVNAAMAYRKRYGDRLTASDMLQIDGTLERNYETMRGAALGNQVAAAALPALQPTDLDRLRVVRTKLESGGRGDFNADGTLLLGPVTRTGERAMGSAQVMPSTARDPGYGIRPADLSGTPAQQAAELRRVGNEKLDVLVKMFDGDYGAVLGAYNWGEQRVKEAQKKAKEAAGAGEVVPRDAWVAYAPKETRDYVARGLQLLTDPTASAPPRPTALQVIDTVRAQLGPNASPIALKAATDAASQRFELQTKAIEQRETETVILAQQQLLQNPDFAALPAGTRSALAQFAPGKVADLMAFAGKVRTGQPIETDWSLYSNLRALAANEPQAFAQQDLRQHFMRLAPAQREQLLDLQTKAKDPRSLPEVASLEAQLGNAHDLLKFAPTDREKKGKFDSVVTSQIAAEQAQKGKPLTFAERQAVIDRNMVTTSAGGWFGFGSKRAYEVAGTPDGLKASPVPTSDEKKLITAALLKELGREPTDAEVTSRFKLRYGIN